MNEEMAQGVELMLTGMSIVFLFLVMLIGAVKLMAYCVATFLPDEAVPAVTPNKIVPNNAVTPVMAAAITGAVHQHRAKNK